MQINFGMQTDTMQIRLLDLPNEEIIRLMNLLNEYYRAQTVEWMAPQKPLFDFPFSSAKNKFDHF